MTDDIWSRNEIDSPCEKICVLHRISGLCIGCHRTADEIARWSLMTPEEREKIMASLPGREPHIAKRRGGRKARHSKR